MDSTVVVVSYDVVEDRRRARVAKLMEGYGRRVQKSVFECFLDEGQFVRLQVRLDELIDLDCDSVRFYRLCKRCRRVTEVLGTGPVIEDEDVIIR